jgi:hypothetical protein
MEPQCSLPSSQELSTCTYPEPDQSIRKQTCYETINRALESNNNNNNNDNIQIYKRHEVF